MSGGRDEDEARTARVKRARLAGLAWAIPLAALGLAVWLAMQEWVFGAIEATVTFPEAQGVSKGTPVRFKGVQVGTVESIRVTEDLQAVEATLAIEDHAAEALREGARFWISAPGLGGGLASLVSGAYVAMEPGAGERRERFTGLAQAPGAAEAGLGSLIERARTALDRLAELPLERLVQDVADSVARIEALLGEPGEDHAHDTLPGLVRELSGAAAAVDRLADQLATRIGTLPLEEVARELADSLSQIEDLLGRAVPQDRDVPALIEELTEAAAAVRELASYLTRHPEALLRGRAGG